MPHGYNYVFWFFKEKGGKYYINILLDNTKLILNTTNIYILM